MSLDRACIGRCFGAPTDPEGSVNEPRSQSEHGVVWKEEWAHRSRGDHRVERSVRWNRYDRVGVVRVGSERSVAREALPES